MVTHWVNHWDKIPHNQTYYPFHLVESGISFLKGTWKGEQPVPTIFIKLNENTQVPEKAWEGYTFDFKIDSKRKRIYFRVKIEKKFKFLLSIVIYVRVGTSKSSRKLCQIALCYFHRFSTS